MEDECYLTRMSHRIIIPYLALSSQELARAKFLFAYTDIKLSVLGPALYAQASMDAEVLRQIVNGQQTLITYQSIPFIPNLLYFVSS
jgi:hypothetical protein